MAYKQLPTISETVTFTPEEVAALESGGSTLEQLSAQVVDSTRQTCSSELVAESVNHPGQAPVPGEVMRSNKHDCLIKSALGESAVALTCESCSIPAKVDETANKLMRTVERRQSLVSH